MVGSLGHGMRGAGASFGFPPITALGARLEEAAANRDAIRASDLLRELDSYLEAVQPACA